MGIPGSYLVATDQSYIGDLVKLPGRKCHSRSLKAIYFFEYRAPCQRQSRYHIETPHGMPDEVKKMFQKEFKQNDIWKHFKAVKNNQVYDLEEIPFGITANVDADDAMTQLYNLFYKSNGDNYVSTTS